MSCVSMPKIKAEQCLVNMYTYYTLCINLYNVITVIFVCTHNSGIEYVNETDPFFIGRSKLILLCMC